MSQNGGGRIHVFASRDLRDRFFETPRFHRRDPLDQYLAPFILRRLSTQKGDSLDESEIRLLVDHDGPPATCFACQQAFQPVRVAYLKHWKIKPGPKEEEIPEKERPVVAEEVQKLFVGLNDQNQWLLPFLESYPASCFPTLGVPIYNGNFILSPKGEELAFCGSPWQPEKEPVNEFTHYEPNQESHLTLALKRIREQGIEEFSYARCTLPIAHYFREERRLRQEEEAAEKARQEAEALEKEAAARERIEQGLTF